MLLTCVFVFPIVNAAGFGNSAQGGSSLFIADRVTGSNFTITEDGTADNITVLLYSGSTRDFACAIYNASNSALIGNTTEYTGAPSITWITFPFLAPKPSLYANTQYYLVCWNYASGMMYYSTATGRGRYDPATYPYWPNPGVFTTENNSYSIYCNYTAGGAPPPDTTPPSLNWTSITDQNVTITNRTWSYFNLTASENVSNCTLEWNYTINYSMNEVITFAWLNLTNISNGNYSYYAFCNDTSGNIGNSSRNWVTVDMEDLILNLTFNENISGVCVDYSHYSNNGVLNNVTYNTDGITGYSGQFYGWNDSIEHSYCRIPVQLQLNTIEEFTAMAWINPSINYQEDGTDQWKFYLIYWPIQHFLPFGYHTWSNGNIESNIWNNSVSASRVYIRKQATLTAGTWYHLTAVYNRSLLILYYNGIAVSNASALNYVISPGIYDLFIGSKDQTAINGNYTFEGLIDNVYIWRSAKNSTFIKSIYDSEVIIPLNLTWVPPTDINVTNTSRNWTYVNLTINKIVQNCTLEWNYSINYSMNNRSDLNYYYNVTNLFNGNYSYYVFCNDTSGNVGNSSRIWFVVEISAEISRAPHVAIGLIGIIPTFTITIFFFFRRRYR